MPRLIRPPAISRASRPRSGYDVSRIAPSRCMRRAGPRRSDIALTISASVRDPVPNRVAGSVVESSSAMEGSSLQQETTNEDGVDDNGDRHADGELADQDQVRR